MKVTVCFGNTRVIVPCGSGEILVGDLIKKAIVRYKKAIAKPADYWVTVHNLKSMSDGGILDVDDRLTDVADDREQIIALFEEQDAPPLPHNGGDGTSASSVGTSSPDMFHSMAGEDKNFASQHLRQGHKNDVVVTREDLNRGSALMVRRGSEPVLTAVGRHAPPTSDGLKNGQRWPASVHLDDGNRRGDPNRSEFTDTDDSQNHDAAQYPQRTGGNGEDAHAQQQKGFGSRFNRESGRQSMVNSHQAMYRWLESQQSPLDAGANAGFSPQQLDRKEPLGGRDEDTMSSAAGEDRNNASGSSGHSTLHDLQSQSSLVVIPNGKGPLGIHVVPDFDKDGREIGLAIQSIEAGSRISKDGRLQVSDHIIEINGTNLNKLDFSRAKDVFKDAMSATDLQLRVVRGDNPVFAATARPPKTSELNKPVEVADALSPLVNGGLSPVKKTPPAPPERRSSTGVTSSPSTPTSAAPSTASAPTPAANAKAKLLAPTNTKKIGKKIYISLTKGADGLGFSITTRDNPTGGACPIYIKNILPKGAAVDDGRLRSGDRLLEVNGEEITGKTQSEAVQILRNMRLGSVVELVVSRQVLPESKDDTATAAFVPRPISSSSSASVPLATADLGAAGASASLQPQDKANDPEDRPGMAGIRNKELLTLEIPLNETGSAGLGVSVKGKTATSQGNTHDLGIFIKSVIKGGAASKDNRLKINDQLVEVNAESLTGKTNAEAMETLRTAMAKDGPRSGYIKIIVARRRSAPVNGQNGSDTAHARELRVSQADAEGQDIPDGLVSSNADINMNEKPDVHYATVQKMRNPALDRLMPAAPSSAGSQNIRNLSYQRATHESADGHLPDLSPIPGSPLSAGFSSSGIAQPANDGMKTSGEKTRPASTIGFLRGPPTATHGASNEASSRSNDNLLEEQAPKPPGWLLEWEKRNSDATKDNLSPDSENDRIPFSRDGFGRQSMSEKRKGHVDPKVSEFYQRLKENKGQYHSATWDPRRSRSASIQEEGKGSPMKRASSMESLLSQSNNRESYAHEKVPAVEAIAQADEGNIERVFRPISVIENNSSSEGSQQPSDLNNNNQRVETNDHGPTLGLKKSSSLESLQTAVQEASTDDQGVAGPAAPYYKPPTRMVRGRGCNESFRTAVDRSYDEDNEHMDALEEESSESSSARGDASRGSSFNGPESQESRKAKRAKSKKEKSSSSLFKGLGSMFRFGKNRRPLEDRHASMKTARELHKEKQQQGKPEGTVEGNSEQAEHDRLVTLAASFRVQEQYRKLQEKKRQVETQTAQQRAITERADASKSHAERIAELRQRHQRQHAERRGQYPNDEQEERYERELARIENEQQSFPLRPPRRRDDLHYNAASDRTGYLPREQSHYANYAEIQAHKQRNEHYMHYRERSAPVAHPPPPHSSGGGGREGLPHSISDSRVFTAHSVYVQDPYSRSQGAFKQRSITPNPNSASQQYSRAASALPGNSSYHHSVPNGPHRPTTDMLERRPQSTRPFMEYPDFRQTHPAPRESSYGSLPRRNKHAFSGAAQV